MLNTDFFNFRTTDNTTQSSNVNGVPPSPAALGRMNQMPTHNIPHVWLVKRCKNPNKVKCIICNLSMGFFSVFEKCQSCKVCVHPDCKSRVQDNCGLTARHFKELLTHMVISARQDNWAPNIGTSRSMTDMPIIQYTDPQTPTIAESSSSANSSTPSTPAGIISGLVPTISVHPPPAITSDRLSAPPPRTADLPSRSKQFTFPEVLPNANTESDAESANSSLSNGSTAFSSSYKWDRRVWNVFTFRNRSTWKELTIPLREIKFDQMIGAGRFSDVYQVDYFGTVAMKLPQMDHIEDEDKRVEVFKQEVACYQNVRHENLVFFCGYTLDPSKLGIILERIRGPSLYSYLHELPTDSQFDFNVAVDYAKQICQGLSYLQTKNILHKDLRSKNIFIENRKAIITDFGLFNVKRLMYPKRNNGFVVPDRWLCYQAPEFLRVLHENLDQFTFTEKTDVFAFGTIWYELLTQRFPFQGFNSQTIIFQVGIGMKASLGKLSVNREAKSLIMECWKFNPTERTTFVDILTKLEAMPRKTLRRSPSFPAYKSFESTF